MKGSYILVVFLGIEKEIKIGSLGNLLFFKGYYLYVGSAMGHAGSSTLLSRIRRHLLNKTKKKIHWHIDYLLADENALISKIYLIPTTIPLECIIARELFECCDNFIENFGSSDCNCISHLFYYKKFNSLLDIIK